MRRSIERNGLLIHFGWASHKLSGTSITTYYLGSPQLVDIDNNQGYEIIKEPLSNGLRNLLIIHKAEEDDFGQYNCSVWNQFGYDTRLITVRKQSRWHLLLIHKCLLWHKMFYGHYIFFVACTVMFR